ncbi:hypothetical protein [Phytohabitans rumicis]|uniref:hypothetical protein n=1 Tax=Phytohabitans rumicis TaxID=1076125 RepID=UPI001565B2D1|nr:hypothetical protein [Phytohabitans rumicis]
MWIQQLVVVLADVPSAAALRAYEDLAVDDGLREGIGSVAVRRPAPHLADAAMSAVHDLEAAGLRPLRIVTGDWVTLADIASRIGRSREIVRLWSVGRQGPGGFPPPLNPGCDTSFYSWAEVGLWLRRRMGYELPDDEPVLVAINLALQLRRLMPRLSHPDAIHALLDG